MRRSQREECRRTRSTSGFTLIEMLVVVAILVILAGFILPKLDRAQLKANKGVAAANLGGVSRYIQTFRILHNRYPDGWDSLYDRTGAAMPSIEQGTSTDIGLEPQLTGPSPNPEKLVASPTTLVAGELRSLNRLGIGTVYDWDASESNHPGNNFNQSHTLAVGDTVVEVNAADGDGAAIIDHIYPQNVVNSTPGAIPSGKRLIAFGFGPLNECIGDVLQECPTYSNTDPTKYYNRNIAIFEIDDGGSRCELKAVVGADADRIDEEINDFYE